MSASFRTVNIEDPISRREMVGEIAAHFKRCTCVPFCGAGISAEPPSCLPLANQLKDPLRALLRDAGLKFLGNDIVNDAEWARIDGQDILNAPLERILDVFHEVYDNEALLYLSVLDSKITNRNHEALASLAVHEYLQTIITLNFDRLFEKALNDRSVPWRLVNTLLDDRFDDKESRCVQIIKPHGSLPETNDGTAMAESLGATLRQVGSGPDRRNQECIASILHRHPVLLVAGYHDSDWDIFPLLARLADHLQHVYWAQHSSAPELPRHVVEWLEERRTSATLLRGNIANLLADTCEALTGEVLNLDDRETRSVPRASDHFPSCSKNALALAMLIEGGKPGSVRRRLLRTLQHDNEIQTEPRLKALRLRCIASILHTSRRVGGALIANNAAYRIQRVSCRWSSPILAAKRIWIGYEWLCLAKRMDEGWLNRVFHLIGNVIRGVSLLFASSVIQGTGRTRSEQRLRKRNKTLAVYYTIDLVHTWASILLLKGEENVSRHAYIFRLLHKGYEFAGRFGGELMEWEYYWLRDIESQVLGGMRTDKGAIEQGLRELAMAYELTQNTVQMGNTYCYLALFEFSQGGIVTDQIVKWLDQAYAYWSTPEHWTPSGLYRVTLFRRYMGIITEKEAKAILMRCS